jgi:hypothetical protein
MPIALATVQIGLGQPIVVGVGAGRAPILHTLVADRTRRVVVRAVFVGAGCVWLLHSNVLSIVAPQAATRVPTTMGTALADPSMTPRHGLRQRSR